jgi:midasin (ATPase involved in ribosome maturation)
VDLGPFLGCDASGIRLCYRWFSSTELTNNLERFLRTRSRELMVHQTNRTLPSFARTPAELSRLQSDIDRMRAMIGDRSESGRR